VKVTALSYPQYHRKPFSYEDPTISIKGSRFKEKEKKYNFLENRISKRFLLRKIKRYRGVVQSESYKRQGNHKVYHIMNENIPHIIYQIKTWFIQFNISNWKELVCTL
jgi:hypothetical protein